MCPARKAGLSRYWRLRAPPAPVLPFPPPSSPALYPAAVPDTALHNSEGIDKWQCPTKKREAHEVDGTKAKAGRLEECPVFPRASPIHNEVGQKDEDKQGE